MRTYLFNIGVFFGGYVTGYLVCKGAMAWRYAKLLRDRERIMSEVNDRG